MSTFTSHLQDKLDSLKASSSYRVLPPIQQLDGGLATYRGKTMFNLSGNDYLGIGCDCAWRKDFFAHVGDLAMSAVSSRLLTGNHEEYDKLEAALSAAYSDKSALVFNCGYHANTGILPALAQKGDLIIADKLNHASLIDGLRLGAAKFERYRHLDYADLERRLESAKGKYRQIFIVTESVFSMDGDRADLRKLVELKRKYDAFLFVDEAHSVGCSGPDGLGATCEEGLLDDVDLIMGTLGKAYGSCGAFAIMSSVVREYLVNTMRPFIFTTGLPPINIAWTSYVLGRMPELDARRQRLKELGDELRRMIRAHGYDTRGDSQIVPLLVGDNDKTVALARKMQENGVLVFPIRPPTVPVGTSRLRFSLSAVTPDEALETIDRVLG